MINEQSTRLARSFFVKGSYMMIFRLCHYNLVVIQLFRLQIALYQTKEDDTKLPIRATVGKHVDFSQSLNLTACIRFSSQVKLLLNA